MARKIFNERFSKISSSLFFTPVLFGAVFSGEESKVHAKIGQPKGIGSNISRLRPTSTTTTSINNKSLKSPSKSNLPSSSTVKYKLTKSEKALGGLALGVAGIGLVGTAVGLGLTESQYEQTKRTYEDIIKRTYDSFYDEREKYLSDLFSQWGVPMPDKFKNPISNNSNNNTTPTPGFSIGTEVK